jgi:hypothetical protein
MSLASCGEINSHLTKTAWLVQVRLILNFIP